MKKRKTYGNIKVSTIKKVYDGDTFRCNISDWPAIVGMNVSIRIAGIDTPEIRGSTDRIKELARNAKRFSQNKLKKAEKVELRNMRRGKYFRILADVYIDEQSLAELLIKSKFAKPYDGKKKPKW
ncbi:micrococcal nuclease [Candidatus Magnetomoraceae bacterium gMMP-15]